MNRDVTVLKMTTTSLTFFTLREGSTGLSREPELACISFNYREHNMWPPYNLQVKIVIIYKVGAQFTWDSPCEGSQMPGKKTNYTKSTMFNRPADKPSNQLQAIKSALSESNLFEFPHQTATT